MKENCEVFCHLQKTFITFWKKSKGNVINIPDLCSHLKCQNHQTILAPNFANLRASIRPNIRPNIRSNSAEYSVSADTNFYRIGRSLEVMKYLKSTLIFSLEISWAMLLLFWNFVLNWRFILLQKCQNQIIIKLQSNSEC